MFLERRGGGGAVPVRSRSRPAMSRATKRKHVTREVLEEHVVPAPQQRIVRVRGAGGLWGLCGASVGFLWGI